MRFQSLCFIALIALNADAFAQSIESQRQVYRGSTDSQIDAHETLGRVQAPLANEVSQMRSKGLFTASQSKLWPKKSSGVVEVPYFVLNDAQGKVPAAIAIANEQLKGIIQWVPATTDDYDIVVFDLQPESALGVVSCYSQLGRTWGSQTINGPCSVAVLLREMGQSMGLMYESLRDSTSNWIVVDNDQLRDFARLKYYPASTNIGIVGSTNPGSSGTYDYGSIMHLSAFVGSSGAKPAVVTKPIGIPIGQSTRYSATDIEGLKRLYGVMDRAVTIDTFPSGLPVQVDGQPYVAPAVFNWALGSMHRISAPRGVQYIDGNAYVFARWSSDVKGELQSDQIITIDAGNGAADQPVNLPRNSTYVANFAALIPVETHPQVSLSPDPESIEGKLYYRLTQTITATPFLSVGQTFANWTGSYSDFMRFPQKYQTPLSFSLYTSSPKQPFRISPSVTSEPVITVSAVAGDREISHIADLALNSTSLMQNAEITVDAPLQISVDNQLMLFKGWEGVQAMPSAMGSAPNRIRLARPTSGVGANYVARYEPYAKVTPQFENAMGCGSVATTGSVVPTLFPLNTTATAVVSSLTPGVRVYDWRGPMKPAADQNRATGPAISFPAPTVRLAAGDAPLAITSVEPSLIDGTQSTEITIRGEGFLPTTSIMLGQFSLSTRFTKFIDSKTLRLSVPAGLPPGPNDLQVNNNVDTCWLWATASSAIQIKGAMTVPSSSSTPPPNGWWWNPNESGRGFFFERRAGNVVFAAGFVYDDAGEPTWFTMTGPMNATALSSSAATFKGGQTLTGSYAPPTIDKPLGGAQWSMSGRSLSIGNVPISPVLPLKFGGTAQSNVQSGWWWNASESGTGYAIQIQGEQIFLVAFMYDNSGKPVWYSSAGTMQSAATYRGKLMHIRGGQPLGAAYRAPSSQTELGDLSIDFTSPTTAQLSLPGGRRVPITRFLF
jgi:hypothetical protein